jgi:hypothetical protein
MHVDSIFPFGRKGYLCARMNLERLKPSQIGTRRQSSPQKRGVAVPDLICQDLDPVPVPAQLTGAAALFVHEARGGGFFGLFSVRASLRALTAPFSGAGTEATTLLRKRSEGGGRGGRLDNQS